jgi:hypothetical protein
MSTIDSQSGPAIRSATEVVIRMIVTQAFALANYGHLCSLLKVPKGLHVGSVIMFFFQPTIIVGQLLDGLGGVDRYLNYNGTPPSTADFQFYIQGLIGVHAQPHERLLLDHGAMQDSSITLFNAGHESLQYSTYQRSWKWFGRVLVCLFAIAQAIGTVLLFARRLEHEGGREVLLADTLICIVSLGSATSGVLALIILLMRVEWQLIRPARPDTAKYSRHGGVLAQSLHSFICVGWIGRFFTYLLYGPWMIGLLVYCFPQDILRRAGISPRVAGVMMNCLGVCLSIVDFISKLVECISDLTTMENGGWKDPLSDKLLVI